MNPEKSPIEESFETPLESHGRLTPLSIAKGALRYLLPLALTIVLVWYMFRKVNFADMLRIMEDGADYRWILLAMTISIFSHIFRAMRWRIQLRAIGINAPLMALSCSIFGCYALNLVFPRLGEIWRCTYVSRRQKGSFSAVFGSMVADRMADSVTVLLLMLLALGVANSAILAFLDKYPLGQGLLAMLRNPWFWGIGASAVTTFVALFFIFKDTSLVRKLKSFAKDLWHGFSAILSMKGRLRFILLTLCIWGCYFIQLYVAFFAFPFTERLCHEPGLAAGFIPCLVAFVLSTIGMAIPSNGGLGPWNIAIMFGLALYGVSDAQGTAFSMLQWSGQTVMLIALGVFTMVYIALDSRKNTLK